MKRGFNLIELMIVVAIVAIVAAIAIPNLLSARLRGNETAAVVYLRQIAEAQESFRGEVIVDQDENGVGEYGLLGELSGSTVPRNKGANKPGKSRLEYSFNPDSNGIVARNGYFFQVFLAEDGKVAAGNDADLGGTSTARGEILYDTAAVRLQETTWCAYAWPIDCGRTGLRTFFIDEQGVVWALAPSESVPVKNYSGVFNAPKADAAYVGPPFLSKGGKTATNDQRNWVEVK